MHVLVVELRSLPSRPSTGPSDLPSPDVCQQRRDRGPCEAYHVMYYYDVRHRRCHHFVYGGCGGNGNRFESIEECQRRCERVATPQPRPTEEPTRPTTSSEPTTTQQSTTTSAPDIYRTPPSVHTHPPDHTPTPPRTRPELETRAPAPSEGTFTLLLSTEASPRELIITLTLSPLSSVIV